MGQFIESPIFLLSKCCWEISGIGFRPPGRWNPHSAAGRELRERVPGWAVAWKSRVSRVEDVEVRYGKIRPKKMEESKFGVPTAQMSSFQLWGQLGFQLRGKRIISTKTIKTSEGALHLKICQPAVQPSPSLPGTNRRPACVKLRKLHRRSHNLLT